MRVLRYAGAALAVLASSWLLLNYSTAPHLDSGFGVNQMEGLRLGLKKFAGWSDGDRAFSRLALG
jgi:hypothetical protein